MKLWFLFLLLSGGLIMSSFGIHTLNSKGEETLNVTDKITRIRWTYTTTTGESGSIVLPDIAGKKSLQYSVGITHAENPHTFTRNGTLLEWSGTEASILVLFLYT